ATNTASSIGVDAAATLKISGAISGPGGLTKVGDGTLTLANTANSYGGDTTINAGTLQLGAAGVIPDSSSVTVAAGAVFDLHGFSEAIDALNGGGTVTSSAAGTVTLTVGASNGSGAFAGVLQDGSGTLALTKTGTGTQPLSAPNPHPGLPAASQGAITTQSNPALGAATAGTTVAAGAALQLQGPALTTVNEPLTLNGAGQSNTGALRALSGTPTW